MTMSPTYAKLSALALAALLAACESSVPLNETGSNVPVETRNVGGTGSSSAPGAGAGGTPQSQVATVDLARGGAGGTAMMAAPTQRVIYFDFDSFAIRDEFKPVIDGHAKVLAANKAKRMVLEGHADERGSREYNLALGQKRAEAVLRSLTLLGVADAQLEAVSFGEERPVATGHDEAAWAKNRRVELKDR
jgi:peptidoglycan-associated lipoprotein